MSADPSAALAGIREDIEATVDAYNLDGPGKNSYPVSAAMIRHTRVTVVALEAVLALADEWDAESDEFDDLAERPGADEEGAPIMAGQAIGLHDCAETLREAITAALTGEEVGDGG